jgi:hypothetical protein
MKNWRNGVLENWSNELPIADCRFPRIFVDKDIILQVIFLMHLVGFLRVLRG